MTIEKSDVIDIVAFDPENRPILVACDAGTIKDPGLRLKALEAKLMSYAKYVTSGKFTQDHPGFSVDDVLFVVACEVAPTPEMELLESISFDGRQFTVRFDCAHSLADTSDPFDVSETMQELANSAFQLVDTILETTNAFSFIWCLRDGEKVFVQIPAAAAAVAGSEEPLDIARRWLDSNGGTVECLVVMCSARSLIDEEEVDMAVASCVERRQKEGFVLTRCLQANDETGMLEPAGDIEFETRFPNTLL